MFEMPKPGDAHRLLARLAGTWVGEETMHPGPMGPGGTSRGFTLSRMSPDGFYLLADYRQEKGGATSFHGHGVIGYDALGKRYLWYWADSMGMPPPHATAGQWKGDDLVFEGDTPHGRTRYTYALKAVDRYVFKIEFSAGAGKAWMPFMEGDYRRAK